MPVWKFEWSSRWRCGLLALSPLGILERAQGLVRVKKISGWTVRIPTAPPPPPPSLSLSGGSLSERVDFESVEFSCYERGRAKRIKDAPVRAFTRALVHVCGALFRG